MVVDEVVLWVDGHARPCGWSGSMGEEIVNGSAREVDSLFEVGVVGIMSSCGWSDVLVEGM